MKNPKTTIVAILGGIILMALVAALIFKMIDGTVFAEATAAVASFISVLVGLFAADHKTTNDTPE